jgi:DNA-binding response OmpR family regulator
MRFLLVEDDELAAGGVVAGLCAHGHEVMVAHTGREVIGRIIRDRPDVVVMDISLPDLDGVTVTKLIRMDRPTLPVVFTSGYEAYEGLAHAAKNRHTAVLQKPYAIEDLEAAAEGARKGNR